MGLTLRPTSTGMTPDGVNPVSLSNGVLTVGRGEENDLVLPDPERVISKRHCVVEQRGNDYFLTDLSTNGTFLNHASDRIGTQPMPLNPGDVIVLGSYELRVEIEQSPDHDLSPRDPLDDLPPPLEQTSISAAIAGGTARHGANEELDDPLAGDDDLLGLLGEEPPGAARQAAQHSTDPLGPSGQAFGGTDPFAGPDDPLAMPGDPTGDPLGSDLLAPADDPFAGDNLAPGQGARADHAPTTEQYYGGPKSGGNLIGDDFDIGLDGIDQPFTPPPSPPPAAMPPAAMPPAAMPPEEPLPEPRRPAAGRAAPSLPPEDLPLAPEPADDHPGEREQMAAPRAAPALPEPPMPEPPMPEPPMPEPPAPAPAPPARRAPAEPQAPARAAPPRAAPPHQAPPHQAPPRTAPAAASAGAVSDAAARAFLEAAGAGEVPVSDAELVATMERLGQAFGTMVEGLREVLMTRASIKGEFRMNQTQIQAGGNNPLKFSVSVEQALEVMVRPTVRGYLPADKAANEALKDIKAHEVAVISGMEAAFKAMLKRLDPQTLAGRLEERGGLSSFLSGKKARYWEVYERMYGEIAQEAEDDFHTLFGKEFARAYQEQLKKI